MTEPKVLFLDEPTASLDPDIVHKIKAFLKEYQRNAGLSILYTSHNMREMEEMSNRIIFLQHGHIRQHGPDPSGKGCGATGRIHKHDRSGRAGCLHFA